LTSSNQTPRGSDGASQARSGEERFRAAFQRLRKLHSDASAAPLEAEPTNPFEIMIAERLQALRCDVDRLQTRLWWLFALIIGAAVANVIVGLIR
jgi:hypothetical protein